jgi:chromosome segregation ATPase
MTDGEYRELIAFLGERFQAIDRRFDTIDQRLDGIDQRFDGIDQRLDGIDQRFDGIDRRFDTIDQRFDGIDQRFDGIDQRSDAIAREIGTLHRRIDTLEQRVDEGFRDVLGHLDAIYRWLERLQDEYHTITAGLRRIEASLAREEERRELLERDVAELKDRVAMLSARIDELERRLRS